MGKQQFTVLRQNILKDFHSSFARFMFSFNKSPFWVLYTHLTDDITTTTITTTTLLVCSGTFAAVAAASYSLNIFIKLHQAIYL